MTLGGLQNLTMLARRVFSLTEAGWAELRQRPEASERTWAGLEGGA